MIGVIGGSGFYEFLTDAHEATVPEPYGPPAAPPLVGSIDGVAVAFIPRHGRSHEFPPHRVPYRANIDAMRSLGAVCIVAPAAVGSLDPAVAPGHFAVADQLVDRTWGREHTFHEGPEAAHVSFADPYHPVLRALAVDAMGRVGATVHDGGTIVVVQGPRFSTRAESRSFAAAGWTLVNMTQMPEAVLAAEAAIPYVNISVVTDYDVGIDGADPVTHDEVLRRFEESSATLRAGIRTLVTAVAGADLGEPR